MSTVTNNQIYKMPPRPGAKLRASHQSQRKPKTKTTVARWPHAKWIWALSLMSLLLLKGCVDQLALKQSLREMTSTLNATNGTLYSRETEVQQLKSQASEFASSKQMAEKEAGKALAKLQSMYLERLLQFADFVNDNPALSTKILAEAMIVAKGAQLNIKPIVERQKKISPARRLPDDNSISVLSREDFATATILQFEVRDARGEFVTGLMRGDIELTSGGRSVHPVRLELSHVARGRCYVSTVLDCSTSMSGPAFDELKLAAKTITDGANPWIARVLRFASDVSEVSPWSTDRLLHAKAIDSLVANGNTSLFDALERNFNDLIKLSDPRLTILFTDGRDSSGKSPAEQNRIISRYREFGLPVHVLVLDRGEIDADLLRKLASETGGSYQMVSSSKQLLASFKAISDRLKQPVYRLTALGPFDVNSLALSVGGRPVQLEAAKP